MIKLLFYKWYVMALKETEYFLFWVSDQKTIVCLKVTDTVFL